MVGGETSKTKGIEGTPWLTEIRNQATGRQGKKEKRNKGRRKMGTKEGQGRLRLKEERIIRNYGRRERMQMRKEKERKSSRLKVRT